MEGLESSRVGVTTARLFMIPGGKLGTRFEFSRTGWSCVVVDTFLTHRAIPRISDADLLRVP